MSLNLCVYSSEAGSIDAFVTTARSINDTKGAKAYMHVAEIEQAAADCDERTLHKGVA